MNKLVAIIFLVLSAIRNIQAIYYVQNHQLNFEYQVVGLLLLMAGIVIGEMKND